MKCLRCGYCCKKLFVVVIDDPDIGFSDSDNYATFGLSGDGSDPCKHLRGDSSGNYSCSVHDREWYPETPCAQYQSHWPERVCRMGEMLVKNENKKEKESQATQESEE